MAGAISGAARSDVAVHGPANRHSSLLNPKRLTSYLSMLAKRTFEPLLLCSRLPSHRHLKTLLDLRYPTGHPTSLTRAGARLPAMSEAYERDRQNNARLYQLSAKVSALRGVTIDIYDNARAQEVIDTTVSPTHSGLIP